MISRRVNQFWKSKHRKFKNFKSSKKLEKGESSGSRRYDKKKVTCFECNGLGHYKSECPKLHRRSPRRSFIRRKVLWKLGMIQIHQNQNQTLKASMQTL